MPGRDPVTTWTLRPAPPPRAGEAQEARLLLFRALHPDVIFSLCGERPAAWAGCEKVEAGSLRGLLDQLERRFRPSG